MNIVLFFIQEMMNFIQEMINFTLTVTIPRVTCGSALWSHVVDSKFHSFMVLRWSPRKARKLLSTVSIGVSQCVCQQKCVEQFRGGTGQDEVTLPMKPDFVSALYLLIL